MVKNQKSGVSCQSFEQDRNPAHAGGDDGPAEGRYFGAANIFQAL